MATTCRDCGYYPIGPYIDNCPICAAPVRGDVADSGREASGNWPSNFPPLLIAGWLVIGATFYYLFYADLRWTLLAVLACGSAWWAVVRCQALLPRLVGASLLALFVAGIVLATQHDILPGLDRRDQALERALFELIVLQQMHSPDAIRTAGRMHTITLAILAGFALGVAPLSLLIPPLLSSAWRRRLGGLNFVSETQAVFGFATWILLMPALAWFALPTMRTWTEPPREHPALPAVMQWQVIPQGPAPNDD